MKYKGKYQLVPLKPLMIEDGLIAFNHASASNGLNWYFVITLPGFCCIASITPMHLQRCKHSLMWLHLMSGVQQ